MAMGFFVTSVHETDALKCTLQHYFMSDLLFDVEEKRRPFFN